jgi:putative SOS response-associated peptidase YedK
MCGRYVSVAEKADLVELYQATAPDPLPAPSYNVAPTQQVTAVIETRDRGGERDRRLKPVKWGLIPSWATDPKIGSRMINARQEGLESKPAWRGSFSKKRAILGMSGFFEWMPVERANGTVRKQPYYMRVDCTIVT